MMKTERRPANRCLCGNRISKLADTCSDCHRKRMAAIHEESRAIVATGHCPTCGTVLRRNTALSGWWQCSDYRKCSFQCFTE